MKIQQITHEHLRLAIGTAGLVVGAVLMFIINEIDDIVGLGFMIMGTQFLLCNHTARVVWRATGPTKEMYERGFELGQMKGYREGRREARPVVVPMFRGNDGATQEDIFSS